MYQTQAETKIDETESCIRSQAHFLAESRMEDFLVILDAQTLVLLLLLDLEFPCPPHRQLLLSWQRLIASKSRQKWIGKMGYQFQVNKLCTYPLQDLPN